MTDGFLTLTSLLTMSGCSLVVYLMTQYTKKMIDKYFHIPTDFLAIMYAFIIIVLAQIANGANPLNWVLYFMGVINALLVALAAGQIHQKASNPPTPTSKNTNTAAASIENAGLTVPSSDLVKYAVNETIKFFSSQKKDTASDKKEEPDQSLNSGGSVDVTKKITESQ